MMNQLDNSINKKVKPILTEINAYKARTIKDMEVKPTKKRTKPQSINSEEDGEDDDNGLTRRSSRKRFKPLKFWKNERLEHEVETLPDGQIQKVLKVKKITNSNSPKIKMKSNLKKSKAIANKVEQYNQLCQLYQPNQPTSNDFTFPYTSISTTSPDDITETYSINIQYNQPSNLLTGTIDLFPYQTKPIRSTQSSKFVYQIQFGRCMFEINDQTFMVGMGGSIIIDKDKSYNITNPDKWIARLGFVQIAK